MTISTIWEPVLDAADAAGSGSRGRGGRRSSSIIAGRRPSRGAGASSRDNDDKNDSADEERSERPAPRRRRRSSAAAADESRDTRQDEAKPAPRRRRRSSAPAVEESESDDAVAEEAPAPRRRRRSRAAAAETDAAPVAEEDSATSEDDTSDVEAVVKTKTPARRSIIRTPASTNGSQEGELGELRALVEQQSLMLSEVRAGLLTLGEQLDRSAQKLRLGVFVDVPNLMYGQEPDETPVNMGRLLDFLRPGRDIVRATAYSPVSDNPAEPMEQQKFVAPFVPYEYRIVTKPLKRFADGSIKGNFDVEMAIDMLTMADRLDVIAIVSGDADFARAVEVVQTRGVRVEVVAFARSSSLEMRSLADRYIELGSVIDQMI